VISEDKGDVLDGKLNEEKQKFNKANDDNGDVKEGKEKHKKKVNKANDDNGDVKEGKEKHKKKFNKANDDNGDVKEGKEISRRARRMRTTVRLSSVIGRSTLDALPPANPKTERPLHNCSAMRMKTPLRPSTPRREGKS